MIGRVADEIIRGYVKEACGILGFDMSNVLIIYVPQIPTYMDIPQHAAITPDRCLIFDESCLFQCLQSSGYRENIVYEALKDVFAMHTINL